uniref:Uncharacterized protein n=1 Tax=Romanomermis culicivorax TaxID=13658 RepID=A0A915JJC9_ROMCU
SKIIRSKYKEYIYVYCNNSKLKAAFIKLINKNCRNSIDKNLRARPDLSYLQRKRSRELQAELQGRLAKDDLGAE